MSADSYQDNLAFLAKTPQLVAGFVHGLNRDHARIKGSGESFSATEHVCHLRDVEQEGYVVRARRIQAEDNPLLDSIDGGKLAVERDYQSQDLAAALIAFTTARNLSIRMLRNATETQRQRPGRIGDSGEVTLGRLVEMMREHDSEHLAELQALRAHLTQLAAKA